MLAVPSFNVILLNSAIVFSIINTKINGYNYMNCTMYKWDKGTTKLSVHVIVYKSLDRSFVLYMDIVGVLITGNGVTTQG